MTTVLSSHLWEKEAVRCITLATIKKATDDFSSERVIGRGAFAKVYEVCARARSAPRTTPSILLASLLLYIQTPPPRPNYVTMNNLCSIVRHDWEGKRLR